MLTENFFVRLSIIFCSQLPQLIASDVVFAQQEKQLNANDNALVSDSYRLTLDLKNPRRYLTQFDKTTRTLKIRIIPATADEFKNTSLYDTRFVQRILINEKDSEVTLSIQLKNFPISWMIATQQNPWRIIVDLSRTENQSLHLNDEWNWQPDYIAGKTAENSENGLPSLAKKENRLFSSQEIDISSNNKKTPSLSKKEIEIKSKEKTSVSLDGIKNKTYDLPEIYSRLELIKNISTAKKEELEKQIGNVFGSSNEYFAANTLAQTLYAAGDEKQALKIFRKLIAQNETAFKADDKSMWQAGESAFLTRNFDIANDYLRSLVLNHPGSIYAPYARLRIVDIDELVNSKNKGTGQVGIKNAQLYSNMALSDKYPEIIKVAAALRTLDGVVDEQPNAVKTYQQNLDACVTSSTIPFDLLKNCSYYRDRYLVENDSINRADIAVQQFKKSFPNDQRVAVLENIVQRRVKELLNETAKTQDWTTWVNFEKKSRLALLSFSLSDSAALFTRAEAFEAVGDDKKSVQLYETFLKSSTDQKRRTKQRVLQHCYFIVAMNQKMLISF